MPRFRTICSLLLLLLVIASCDNPVKPVPWPPGRQTTGPSVPAADRVGPDGRRSANYFIAQELVATLHGIDADDKGSLASAGQQLAQRLLGGSIDEVAERHFYYTYEIEDEGQDLSYRAAFVRAFRDGLRDAFSKTSTGLLNSLLASHSLEQQDIEAAGFDVARSLVDETLKAAKASETGFLKNLEVEYTLGSKGRSQVSVLTTQRLYESKDLEHNVFTQLGYAHQDGRNTVNAGIAYRHYDEAAGYIAGVNSFIDYEAPYGHVRASVGGDAKTRFLGLNVNLYKGLSGWQDTNDGYEEKAEDGADLQVSGKLPALPAAEVFLKGYGFKGEGGLNDTYGTEARLEYSPVPALTLSASADDNNNSRPSVDFGIRFNHAFGTKVAKEWNWDAQFEEQALADRRFEKVRRENTIRKSRRLISPAAGAAPDTVLNVLLVGQSNAANWVAAYGGAGAASFVATAQPYYSAVNIVNGALGGAAVDFRAAGAPGAYLDATNTGKGTVYTNVLEPAVNASGIARSSFDEIYVLIGETDAVAIENGTITEADHKSAYLTLVNLLRAEFPNARIISIPLLRDQNGLEFTGWGDTRRAQWELTRDNGFIYEGPAAYDVAFSDDLHPNQAGYEELARRAALAGLYHAGRVGAAGIFGPQITSAEFQPASNLIFLHVTHDNGNDFSINNDIRGYVFDINGTLYSAAFVARDDASTVRTRPSGYNLQPGDNVRILFPWGTLRNINTANIFIDNAPDPRPLKAQFDLTATEIP